MADLTEIVNSLFNKRSNWKSISNEDKDKNFFIINRLLSKKWPVQAQELNKLGIDKSLALDIWFIFLKDESYPKNFWQKGKMGKDALSTNQCLFLMKEYDIKKEEVLYLNNNYPDIIKQLIKEFNI